MDFLWDKITEWLKEMLIGGIVSNLSGMFDATNQKVAEISGQVGLSPQAWNGSIFNMIQNLSETVIVPIAGAILAFVMTLELIQLITDKNNLNDMDTWIFFKWAFKSAAAVLIVTNTWTIVMGVFDAAQSVVASASGLIIGDTSINISSVMVGIEDRLMEMELGPLFGLWFQSLFVGITMWALTVSELARGLENGSFSSEAVTDAYLENIALQNSTLNVFLEVFGDTAREEARASDRRRREGKPLSRLDGVPFAVKDNLCVEG